LAETVQRTAAEISRAELEARDSGGAVVEIYDQIYQLRGTDPAHIERLANVVDAKMRAVSAHGQTVDSLRVAVLAALSTTAAQIQMKARAGSLMGMLDEVLEERKAG
jgi:cell division protein ZapA